MFANTPFNTNQPFTRLRDEMDRLFNNYVSGPLAASGLYPTTGGFPAINLWQDEKCLYVEAEVPGLQLKDVELTVKGDELTLKGSRPEASVEGVTYHRRERGTGAFQRVVRLPLPINEEKVSARLHEGVLTVTLPKADQVLPRKINVQG